MHSRDTLSFLSITLLAIYMLGGIVFPPAFAAGVCREANCADSAPKEDKCDQAALDEARAEYKKWIGIYREQAGAASDAEGYANESVDQALEDAEEFYGEMPNEVKNIPRDYIRDKYIEEIAKKAFSETVAHAVGTGLSTFGIAKILVKQANIAGKEITAM